MIVYDIDIRICQHCKQPGAEIALNSMSKNGTHKYYLCNNCNTYRSKRYRSTPHGRSVVNAAARRWRERNPGYRRLREIAKAEERHDNYVEPIDMSDWNRRARENRLGIIKRHSI